MVAGATEPCHYSALSTSFEAGNQSGINVHTVDMANTANSIRTTAKNSPSRKGRFIIAPAPIRKRLRNIAANPAQPTHSMKPRHPFLMSWFLMSRKQVVLNIQVITMRASTLSMKCELGNSYSSLLDGRLHDGLAPGTWVMQRKIRFIIFTTRCRCPEYPTGEGYDTVQGRSQDTAPHIRGC